MTRRSFLALVGVVATLPGVPAHANTKITLVGRLFRFHPDSDSLNYALDPTGDSEGIELKPLDGGYVSDYLKGSEGRIVNITIEPQPE